MDFDCSNDPDGVYEDEQDYQRMMNKNQLPTGICDCGTALYNCIQLQCEACRLKHDARRQKSYDDYYDRCVKAEAKAEAEAQPHCFRCKNVMSKGFGGRTCESCIQELELALEEAEQAWLDKMEEDCSDDYDNEQHIERTIQFSEDMWLNNDEV